jgi:hypothetical protein
MTPAREPQPFTPPSLKWLIWIYLGTLILEGPLRKWILPQLSNPLLLIRDPVLILIYLTAAFNGALRFTTSTISLMALAVVAGITSMLAGTGNFWVTLYGIDTSFLHLPLIFVIYHALDRRDVERIGRVVLYLGIPMAVLMAVQFRSDPNAFVNVGPGGYAGTQMEAVLGKIRPPGFFNFITGAAHFLTIEAAFLVHWLMQKGSSRRFLLLISGVCLIISVAVSTSRLTLGGIALVFLMIGFIGYYNRAAIAGAVAMLLPLGIAFVIATSLDVFHEGTHVFEARLENTGEADAHLATTVTRWSDRVLGDVLAGYKAFATAPIWGYGIGYGTNVGSRLLTGKIGFTADEREWGRVILEIGPILGTLYLAIRVAICVVMFRQAATSARVGNFLPFLLFGCAGLMIINGQFGVTSTLGFTVSACGLCLAATKDDRRILAPSTPVPAVRLRRGTSPYSAKLRERR